jgi:hypothetical protein
MTQLLRRILRQGGKDGIGFSVPANVLKELEIDEEL